ncbi:MAG: protein arginine kinase [Candidatus Eisenbacteria bacterium]|uniref:Protein arginine kinase n=1 Tax=Eiseniibacteriota bacterium TaxID=2212470 RepID=A0A956LYJ8_UNCEI|nr:protein arginine kinase [Candidatus Eisenbacteria bacterium]
MIPILDMVQGPVRWLAGDGPMGDRILSTRVRLARNIRGTRFVGRALEPELISLRDRVLDLGLSISALPGANAMPVGDLAVMDRQLLLERHLISHDLTGDSAVRGLVLAGDEKVSLMVNEEDHVRIQALAPGFQLEAVFEAAQKVDLELEAHLSFAATPELGYLTACPTNVGTGMRASVLVHLPALVLTQQIKKILAGVNQVGLTVRGFYGEGSEVVGNFFQISNQTTLGLSETETLTKLSRVVNQILEWEDRAQENALRDARLQVEDTVLRALGVLKYSRLLRSEEVVGLLSAVRFGHTLGLRNVPSVSVLNDLLLRCQPAHLQRAAGREMTAEERNAYRAELVQKVLEVRDAPRFDP